MFKAFTAGLVGLVLSASLGVLVASTAVNASAPADASTFTARYMD